MTRTEPHVRSGGRPRIALVAHRVDDSGGMERVHAESVRRLLDRYDFTVISSSLADDLKNKVKWRRVPIPASPVSLRFLLFYGTAALQLNREPADLVHVCGALVPNRADIASVHFCHAGFFAINGRRAPKRMPVIRRINTSFHRTLQFKLNNGRISQGGFAYWLPCHPVPANCANITQGSRQRLRQMGLTLNGSSRMRESGIRCATSWVPTMTRLCSVCRRRLELEGISACDRLVVCGEQ